MKQFLIAAWLLSASAAIAQKNPAPFKAGDKVAFVGNSITEAGFYELYIWQYYQLHFPQRRILVMNAGIGGDVAGQMLTRLDDDVLAQKPSVVVLTFGMNDSRYFEYWNKPEADVRKEAVATSYNSYLEIEKKLKAVPAVQKILMASSPFDETMTGPKNNFKGKHQTMLEIATFQQEAAKKNNWAYVDLIHPMTEINQRGQMKDTNFTITGTDRIHPGNAGHLAMAWLFLKAQGLTNAVVTDVAINAATKKLTKAVNSAVTNLKVAPQQISFDYKSNSLPFPIDSISRLWGNPQKLSEALPVIPFTDELNREMLAVTGLKSSSKYLLSIDGENIGEWSGADFLKGINLALEHKTPQYKQAEQIAELNLSYRELEQKLRAYYWLQYNFFRNKGMYLKDDAAALDSVNIAPPSDWAVASKKENYQSAIKKENRIGWENEMKAIADKIYTINKPVKRRVVVREAK
ncbi:MAG: SGNH/GDSL hydrolase family protein [Bacteroidota bacterium]